MKIAFTSKGTTLDAAMDPRFGRTEYFLIYDEESGHIETFDNRDLAAEAHGAGPKASQRLAEFGPNVLITGNGPGGNAATVLERLGLDIYIGAGDMSVQEALNAYKAGKLEKV